MIMKTAVQGQKAITAYFTRKQLMRFGFAEQKSGELPAGHENESDEVDGDEDEGWVLPSW